MSRDETDSSMSGHTLEDMDSMLDVDEDKTYAAMGVGKTIWTVSTKCTTR